MEKCKNECKVIPKEIDIYEKYDNAATKLIRVAVELTSKDSKPTIETVQEIIGDLEDLKFKNV